MADQTVMRTAPTAEPQENIDPYRPRTGAGLVDLS
jgi:hypothetical protein